MRVSVSVTDIVIVNVIVIVRVLVSVNVLFALVFWLLCCVGVCVVAMSVLCCGVPVSVLFCGVIVSCSECVGFASVVVWLWRVKSVGLCWLCLV